MPWYGRQFIVDRVPEQTMPAAFPVKQTIVDLQMAD